MFDLKIFVKRFRRISRRKQINLILIVLVITIGLGLFIWAVATGRIKPFAASNNISNTATITWTDPSGTSQSALSNTVMTTVETPLSLNATINVQLQGRTTFQTTGTAIYFFTVGTTTVVYSKTDIATDNQGVASISTTLTSGNYDIKIKVNGYLTKTLANTAVADSTTLNFGQLKSGDLNNDGIVDGSDWAVMSGKWRSTSGGSSDLNLDGIVDGGDWAIMSADWRLVDS